MARRKRFPEDPSGAWLPIAGRRPGTPRKAQVGHWEPVEGRPVGSPAYVLGRIRGRFARLQAPPEAHYRWSEHPSLVYKGSGRYLLGGSRISKYEARQIVNRSIVDRGPEARWRWYEEPPRIEFYRGHRFTIDGRWAERDQVQWMLCEQIASRGAERLEWNFLKIDPDSAEDAPDAEDVQAEIGTADVPLEELLKRYAEMPGGQESSDVDEERDVPIESVPDDAEEEARLAWAEFETWAADDTPFGRWIGRAKGLPVLVSYYLVAHKVVYAEEDVVLWGESVRTRYAPFGRGDAYLELKARAEELREKSDDDVVFVAAGMTILMKETFG